MPTKEQYVCALEALVRRGLHEKKRAMLLYHASRRSHTVTMSMLAEHVGYRSFSPANLHYGRLGLDIADLGAFSLPDRRFGISAIGSWDRTPPHPSGQFAFTMRPELVEAVREVLGASKRRARPARPAR